MPAAVRQVLQRAPARAMTRGSPNRGAGSVAADPPAEDELHVLRAADVKVVADEGLEEGPGTAGSVQDDGAGDLDLAHRQLPPVPGVPVRSAERHGKTVQPPLGEYLD